MKELDTYLKYGINTEFAGKLMRQGLSISKIKKLPSADLISIYGLDSSEVQYLKKLFIRQPIPDDVLNELLENNNFVCCVCKGVRGCLKTIVNGREFSESDNDSCNHEHFVG